MLSARGDRACTTISIWRLISWRERRFVGGPQSGVWRRLSALSTASRGLGRVNILGAYFDDLSDQSHSAKFVAMRDDNAALIGSGEPQRVSVVHISSGWTEVFGVQPALGRYFSEDEQNKGSASRVAIISDALWRERFSGNAQVLARTLTL